MTDDNRITGSHSAEPFKDLQAIQEQVKTRFKKYKSVPVEDSVPNFEERYERYEQLAVNGVMCLIEQGAGHRHLRVCEDRVPARLLLPEPLPHALTIGSSNRGGDGVSKATQPLAEGKHPQALALARAVQQGVEL